MTTKTFTVQRSLADAPVPMSAALPITLLASSFAAVFMRLALENGLPPLLVAAGRLGISSLFMTPLVLRYYLPEIRKLTRPDLVYASIAGICFALHFILITISLKYVGILTNQALVNTGPIWVAIIEVIFLKLRLSRLIWLGMFIAVTGSILISVLGGGGMLAGDNLLGSILALIGAMFGAVYLVITRKIRQKVSLIPLVWLVFGIGGLVGLGVITITQTPLVGYPPMGYFWLLMVTLVAQLIGHSGFSYLLGYLEATFVSLMGQLITVVAAVWAFFIFHEVPTPTRVVMSAIIIGGVALAIIGQGQRQRKLRKV